MKVPWKLRLAALGMLGMRSALIIGVLIAAVAAAHRIDLRMDWSANRHFTLDPVLIDIIDRVDHDLRIVGVWPQHAESGRDAMVAHIGALVAPALQLMARRSDHLSWTQIDPGQDLPLLDSLRERYGSIGREGIFLLRDGQRPFRIPVSNALPIILQREMGGALLATARDQQPLAAIFQGHGELRPQGGNEHGITALRRQLELSGFQVAPFDRATLEQWGRLPMDAIVVLAGPTEALGAAMLRAFEQHLRDGGRALILVDHRMDPDLARTLQGWGIICGPLHPVGSLDNPIQVLARDAPLQRPHLLYSLEHSTGRDGSFHRLILRPESAMVEDQFAIMRHTRGSGRLINSTLSIPISVADPALWPDHSEGIITALASLATPPFQGEPLLTLPRSESWIDAVQAQQRQPQGLSDRRGHTALAWAIDYEVDPRGSNDARGPRMVIWGSRQAASDGILAGDSYANAQLLSDMMHWLSDHDDAVPIPAAELQAFRIDAEESTITFLLALLIAIIPCCCLGVAMITWWERR
ncbi:MAG: hypothetical protein EA401_04825 [Planctomycetota bacterium]|nr:MAG: hypothetical protein EA401_04825 [Planctomycetota bacterium]